MVPIKMFSFYILTPSPSTQRQHFQIVEGLLVGMLRSVYKQGEKRKGRVSVTLLPKNIITEIHTRQHWQLRLKKDCVQTHPHRCNSCG